MRDYHLMPAQMDDLTAAEFGKVLNDLARRMKAPNDAA